MKTLKNGILMIMMVMISTMSFANGGKPEVKVETIGAKMIALNASGFGKGETQIKLTDDRGIELHFERVTNGKDYGKKFDLSSLKAGNYSLEVETETSLTIVPVKISQVAASVLESEKVVILKPVLRKNGDLLDIILPAEEKSDVEVSIYDSNSNRLFSEKVNENKEVRRYDLSKLAQGQYRVKFHTRGKEFIQFVAVK